MEAEGMVHALEEIRRLLKPDGFLLDIHPIRKAPLIRVVQGTAVWFVEADPGYDDDEGLEYADAALEEIVRRGSYLVESGIEFEVVTYAASVAEMREYWTEYGAFDDGPRDEAITRRKDEVYARADQIMRKVLDAEFTYHERARITRLKPSRS